MPDDAGIDRELDGLPVEYTFHDLSHAGLPSMSNVPVLTQVREPRRPHDRPALPIATAASPCSVDPHPRSLDPGSSPCLLSPELGSGKPWGSVVRSVISVVRFRINLRHGRSRILQAIVEGSSCVSGGYNWGFAATHFTESAYARRREQHASRPKCLLHSRLGPSSADQPPGTQDEPCGIGRPGPSRVVWCILSDRKGTVRDWQDSRQ